MSDTLTREEWLEQRRSGIGGSDIAAILGVDPFGKTAADVYDEKTGNGVEVEQTLPMKRGNVLEPIAVQQYVEETGRQVRRQPMRRHKQYPFMVGNIDRQQLKDERGTGVLEVKCPGLKNFSNLIHFGLHEGYILQIQHYLEVFGYDWGTFAIFNAEPWKVHWFDVERDEKLISRMIEAEGKFWEMVQEGVRPEEPVAKLDIPKVEGTLILRDDPEWIEAAKNLWEIKELRQSTELLYKDAGARVKALCGKYGTFEGAGIRVHFKRYPGNMRFSKTALKRATPLDYQKTIDAIARVFGQEAISTIDFDSLALDVEQFNERCKAYDKLTPYLLKVSKEEE